MNSPTINELKNKSNMIIVSPRFSFNDESTYESDVNK